MKQKMIAGWRMYFLFISLLSYGSCGNNNTPAVAEQEKPAGDKKIKPGSTITDTLKVSTAAAIFYEPDSVQLKKIKQVNDKNIFDATMHEYFYQVRNSKIYFKQYMPALKIITAKNYRYILFAIPGKQDSVIDLDTKNDAYGLFIFDAKKSPLLVDMMNINDQVPRYFSE